MPISIYQGSDKTFTFSRTDLNGNLIATVPKNIWFTVKQSFESKGFSIQKTLGNGIEQNADGSWKIIVDASDTAELKTGKYVCDVKIRNEHGKEYPIVKPQEFAILDVATRKTNQGV
jgi:hypothetical protein